MLSCDTLVALGCATSNGQNLFAKNSDRPIGEAQPLVFFPAATHPEGEMLRCTHISIQQTAHTYALLGCKPYWMWGLEIGVNVCGVVIGNEAEDSNLPVDAVEGLLGMDILRLGLERGASAYEAMHVMIDLLETYGQNANAHVRADYRSDNSYILADAKEAWILETAGRRWAARRVRNFAAISNCYSIRDDFDEASADIESYARQMRLLAPDAPFDFARAYSRTVLRQQRAVPRYRRLNKLLDKLNPALNARNVTEILRDHFEDDLLAPRYGAGDAVFPSICMHALTEKDSKTAGSLIVSWRDGLGVTCRHCFSNPCISVYIPVYLTGKLPNSFSTGGGQYSAESLWWVLERLNCAVEADSARFYAEVRARMDALESAFSAQAVEAEDRAISLFAAGKSKEATVLLDALTQSCAEQLLSAANEETSRILSLLRKDGGLYGCRADYLREYCKNTEIPFPDAE